MSIYLNVIDTQKCISFSCVATLSFQWKSETWHWVVSYIDKYIGEQRTCQTYFVYFDLDIISYTLKFCEHHKTNAEQRPNTSV